MASSSETNPPASDLPPSEPDAGGDNASGTHQDSPTGSSTLSDTVTLGQDVAQAYAGFDPAQHATNADGSPRMSKGGGFQRKRGRKPGQASAPGQPATVASAQPAGMSTDQGATMILAMTTAICAGVFGDDEWRIKEKQEFAAYKDAVKTYLDATGGLQLSPTWGLAFAGFAYAAPRLVSPPTQTRLQKIKEWFSARFSKAK